MVGYREPASKQAVVPAETADGGDDLGMVDDLDVALLGPLEASVGEGRIDLGGSSQRVVLARLAVAVPRAVSVDALVHAVWGDRPPASARKLIQKHVSGLRKIVGPAAIATGPSGYALCLDADRIDALRFEGLVNRGRSARADGRTRQAFDLYDEALGLWRGPALAGLGDVPFFADEASRLEDLRLDALEEQMDAGLALGMAQELVPRLQELVRQHPLREGLWASLMTGLYRSGRQADALAAYRRLRGVLGDELGIEPSPELAALEERILLHDPTLLAPGGGHRRGNLPTAYTSFVGRHEELSDLVAILGRSRLVTLIGPGGCGKTRLALEAAAAVERSFPDGLWFVDLAGLVRPEELVSRVASSFGLAEEPGTSADQLLLEFLGSKRLLVVLDNCERVVADAAALVGALLPATSAVTVLATSREPLGLTAETLYRVEPLAVPDETGIDAERLLQVEAVRLFVDRAEAADPGFALTTETAPTVAETCRWLDGIPLAIELAARQLHVVGPHELQRGLLAHLELLTAPGQPDPRHRTMERAIEWSYRLLDDDERAMFLALSVLPGTFSAAAVERVCRDLVPAGSTTPLLTGLVSRSMVIRQRTGDEARFRLLELMRVYAAQRAAEAGLRDHLSRRHAEWVVELLTEQAQIVGPDEQRRLRRLLAEQHHLPVALTWAIEHDPPLALRILVAGTEYVSMVEYRGHWMDLLARTIAAGASAPTPLRASALARGALALAVNFADYRTARPWAESALELASEVGDAHATAHAELALGLALRNAGLLDDAERLMGRALAAFDLQGDLAMAAGCRRWLGYIHLARGDYDEVVALGTEALGLARKLDSAWVAGWVWWLIAAALARKGDHVEAEACAARSLGLLEGFGDQSALMHVRAVQGDAARLAGGFDRAEAIYRLCLHGFQEVGDRRCTASTLKNLGMVAIHRGRPEEAGRLLLASLERRARLGDEGGLAECLKGLALVGQSLGADEWAVVLLGAAAQLRADTGVSAPEREHAALDDAVAACRSTLGRERYDAAWARGRALRPDEVPDTARGALDHLTR